MNALRLFFIVFGIVIGLFATVMMLLFMYKVIDPGTNNDTPGGGIFTTKQILLVAVPYVFAFLFFGGGLSAPDWEFDFNPLKPSW